MHCIWLSNSYSCSFYTPGIHPTGQDRQNNYRGLPLSMTTLKWTPYSVRGKRIEGQRVNFVAFRGEVQQMLAMAEQGRMVGPRQGETSCSPTPLSLPTIVLASAHTLRPVWLKYFGVLIAKRQLFYFVGFSSSSLNWAMWKATQQSKPRNEAMRHHKMPDCSALTYSRIALHCPACRVHALVHRKEVSWDQNSGDCSSYFHLKHRQITF